MEKIYHIAVEATLDVIGSKWKPLILCYLGEKTMRATELYRAIPGISQRVLTQKLRELEQDNIVKRQVYSQIPPKVEYSLTEEGCSLRKVLVAMSDWGSDRVAREQEAGEDVQIIEKDVPDFIKSAN